MSRIADAMLRAGAFDVAVIDPPWHYDVWDERTGIAKSPQAQYRTMTEAEILALPVRRLLASGGVAFVWCTWPTLAEGIVHRTLGAWGLVGRSGGAWVKRTRSGKVAIGPGFIWRNACDPVLIARRAGNGGAGPRGRGIRNLIETFEEFAVDGLRRQHSRKPQEFYDLVEALTPGARRVDVFGRQSRSGWVVLGDEAKEFDRWRRQ